jgi:hypothetical protein
MDTNEHELNWSVNGAIASWSAPALWRFTTASLRFQSGRGLPHSKTLRKLVAPSHSCLFVFIRGFSPFPGPRIIAEERGHKLEVMM